MIRDTSYIFIHEKLKFLEFRLTFLFGRHGSILWCLLFSHLFHYSVYDTSVFKEDLEVLSFLSKTSFPSEVLFSTLNSVFVIPFRKSHLLSYLLVTLTRSIHPFYYSVSRIDFVKPNLSLSFILSCRFQFNIIFESDVQPFVLR